jgi:hypothetical protein
VLPYPGAEFIADKLDYRFCGRGVHRPDECLKLVWKNRELMWQIFSLFTKVQEHFEQSLGIGDPTGKSADVAPPCWRCKRLAWVTFCGIVHPILRKARKSPRFFGKFKNCEGPKMGFLTGSESKGP